MTFHELFTALRVCPCLYTLEVSMNAVNIDFDPTAETLQRTPYEQWVSANSRIADPEPVSNHFIDVPLHL